MSLTLSAQAAPVTTPYGQAQLVSTVNQLKPGDSAWLALVLNLKPGWHTYWQNPGDSGMPVTISWQLPQGWHAGNIDWPTPERIQVGPLVNYGYHGTVYFPVLLQTDADASLGPVTLKAEADWLVCQEECIPQSAQLTLPLTLADSTTTSAWGAKLTAWRTEHLPRSFNGQASYLRSPTGYELTLKSSDFKSPLTSAYFIPAEPSIIENAAPQPYQLTGDQLTVNLTAGLKPWHQDLTGLLLVNHGQQQQAWMVNAVPHTEIAHWASFFTRYAFWQALLFAFLGGLILNIMPCVFPILSIKALSAVKQMAYSPQQVRIKGWAFLLGVLVTFLVLAMSLVILQAGGAALGWGFQMQSPLFVALLIYLLFLIGLNLSGVFEFSLPFMGIGEQQAAQRNPLGYFLTGVLAVLVATPCTAPFMGVAMGYALAQPAPVVIAVFSGLALGFAGPFFLISQWPRLGRWLPKPGPWMKTFKELLAFPLYGAAVWLLWVLALQQGGDGVLLVLTGLVLLYFVIWLWPVIKKRSALTRCSLLVLALAICLAPLALLYQQQAAPASIQQSKGAETFSQQRLTALRDADQPVLVNVTAAWCITCKVNERVALTTKSVQTAMTDLGINYLVADWTNEDPDISRYLAEFGRSGVPLYVFYPRAGTPVVLPQLLTPSILLKAFNQQT
jgi:thiol:disulfide interchange protein DsbD